MLNVLILISLFLGPSVRRSVLERERGRERKRERECWLSSERASLDNNQKMEETDNEKERRKYK